MESAIAFYYKLYRGYPAPNVSREAESYGVFRMTSDMKAKQDFNAMPEMTRGLNDYTKKWESLTRKPELFGEKRNLLTAEKLTEILARFGLNTVFGGPVPENRVAYRFEFDPIDLTKIAKELGATVTVYGAESSGTPTSGY